MYTYVIISTPVEKFLLFTTCIIMPASISSLKLPRLRAAYSGEEVPQQWLACERFSLVSQI